MRRLLAVTIAVGAAIAPATPALATADGSQPPGPPVYNHSKNFQGADVFHCQPFGQGAGTTVFTPAGPGSRVNQNCRD